MTAVLVLYRELAEDSLCFKTLRDTLQSDAALVPGFHLVLYDNSPAAQPVPSFPTPVTYLSDTANGGIAAAYQAAMQVARANGSAWMLLLDQDTALTREYMIELRSLLSTVPERAVAVVPRLIQDGKTHSPSYLPRLSHRRLPEDLYGLLPELASVYSSGAAIRLTAIDSFPQRYWLDFLDHAVFHTLQRDGGRVWLMNARLEHRLSTQNLGTEASLGRYFNILTAERDFYRDYGSAGDRIYYHLRRVKQTAGHLLKVKDKRFALLDARAALGLLGRTPYRT